MKPGHRSETRVSRYVVVGDRTYADPFGRRFRVLYGTRLGRVVAVDAEVAAELAAGMAPNCPPRVLDLLHENEILLSEAGAADELSALTARAHREQAEKDIRSFTLFPSSYCNMGCDYCGQSHEKSQVSLKHRAAIKRRVEAAFGQPDVRLVRVGWFGGEPLMGYGVMRDLSHAFVAAAKQSSASYESRLVTNGTLLTVENLVEMHTEMKIWHVEVTLDGLGEVHDAHRPLKNGHSSFQGIVDTLLAALDDPRLANLSLGLRTNVDNRNIDKIDEYVDYMAERGFGRSKVMFKFAPVHSWSNDISANDMGMIEFARREAFWLTKLVALGLNTSLLPAEPVSTVCVAASRSAEVIDPVGRIFACVEHPLVPSDASRALTVLPELADTQLRPPGPYENWATELPQADYGCKSCVLLGVCGGSCPKQWENGEAACPSFKFNLQDRLHLTAVSNGLQPAVD